MGILNNFLRGRKLREEMIQMTDRSILPNNKELTDPEAHKIIKCRWCPKYFNPVTKDYESKPEKNCGDGICLKCLDKMMKDLEV